MTDGRSRTPRTAADLRWMRGSTSATLWVVVVISGFLQLVLGVEGATGPRLVTLVASTLASIMLAIAVVPQLMRTANGASAHRPLVVALVATACLTWVLALVGPFAGWGWGFLLAISGGMLSCLLRRWWSAAVLFATLCAIALGGVAASADAVDVAVGPITPDAGTDFVIVSTLVLITFMPLSTIWVLRVVLRLEGARQTAHELAVATERLRFATDLHDIQGHHLQVIALKGELAERRLLAGEPELAAQELAEIRKIAQMALEDTRAVVNDYRTVTVAVEARNAAAVLRSAGIDCEARIAAPDLPSLVGAVFAVVIREAATNILRHSRATVTSLELIQSETGEYRLTVSNNGSSALKHGGTGLAGITERVAAWDGTVETRRLDDTFTLIVRIPVQTAQHRSEVLQ